MKENNKKIAVYCRTATKNKKQMKEQKERLKKYCEDNDIKNYVIYEDYGYSANNLNRPGYKKMINNLKLGKINKIIITNFDRLARSLIDLAKFNSELDKYNCELVCSQLNNISNPAQIIYKRMINIFAQFEKNMIKKARL